jgi:D-serine deaminase-like pyridoxal phosphate-dependent protein
VHEGQNVDDLATPCAVVDLDRLERNCARMADRAGALGVTLRPHVKTHKCVEVARLQLGARSGGITVSTLAEARRFAAGGFRDIVLAVPLAPARVEDVLGLRKQLDRLAVLLDHPDALAELADCASRRRQRVGAFLKLDCGYHRAGVAPDSELGPALVRQMMAAEFVEFRGVLTHAGHAYACRDRAEVLRIAEQERAVTVAFAERLRAAGLEVPAISIGSTPTMAVVEDLAGVDEIRPGNYAYFDVFQAALGVCALHDVAFSVLTTVVGRYPERDALVVDAGALALSKDTGFARASETPTYGVLTSVDGEYTWRDLALTSLSQEHGLVHATEGLGPSDHFVGEKMRVLPNHACLSAAMFDAVHVVRGERVVERWHPVRGW